MTTLFKAIVTIAVICVSFSANAERLVAIGGGSRPAEAMAQFAEWAHGGTILIIGWASEVPKEGSAAVAKEFSEYFKGDLEFSLTPPDSGIERWKLIRQLLRARGVFFIGGDQSRIMDTFSGENGPELLTAFKTAYEKDVVFGGTSAGTAVMSKVMIAGNFKNGEIPLRSGMGLLPDQIVVDQHFSQRNRETRLVTAMRDSDSQMGLGIDEDTALLIVDNQHARVVGDFSVSVFRVRNGELEKRQFRNNERLNLVSILAGKERISLR